MGVQWAASNILWAMRFSNLICFWFYTGFFFKWKGGFDNDYIRQYIGKSYPLFIAVILILIAYDRFIIYAKRNHIFAVCNQFPLKRQIIGKNKFRLYVVLTFLMIFGLLKLINSNS
jgi:hypothetical protein